MFIITLLMNGLGAMLCAWSVMDAILALHIGAVPSSYNHNLTTNGFIVLSSLEAFMAGVAFTAANMETID